MLKLNDTNIYVGQIKQLLKNFNLPTCRVYKDDLTIHSGLHYIKSNAIYSGTSDSTLEFKDSYYKGQYLQNLTTNLRITNNIYDSYTHKYLGRYLRFLKDYDDLNLMSMYNCFSGEFSTNMNVSFVVNNLTKVFNSKDTNYTLYTVPVRFNENYTIAINCNSTIEVFSTLYDNNNITDDETLFISTYDRLRDCNFNKPYLYTKLKDFTPNYSEAVREHSLVLIVKVPVSIDSSVVVLEGDFRDGCKLDRTQDSILQGRLLRYRETIAEKDESGKTTGNYDINDLPSWFGNFNYNSKPELLDYTNMSSNYVLSSRLIEYLTGNVITNISEGYDIRKVQERLITKNLVNSDYLGMWSNNDRKGLYRYVNDTLLNSNNFDVLSYLDKDVEKKIGGIE